VVEQLTYLQPEEEKPKPKPKPKKYPLILTQRLLSRGPLLRNPIFHKGQSGTGEIMTITEGPDDQTVILHWLKFQKMGLN